MTEVDFAAVFAPFANLDPAGRVELAREVADQLERLLEAADDQDVGMSAIMRAHVMGGLVVLRAISQ